MVRNIVLFGLAVLFVLVSVGFADPRTQVTYDVIDIGSGRWEYTYDIANISLAGGVGEFTIWFDYGLYDNLFVSTPLTPSNWDQIVWQVEPVLEDSGGYDALAMSSNIAEGESLNGFTVSFDWLGIGRPGSQYYEIINPSDFSTIEDGYTVPEPMTGLFLFSGIVFLRLKRELR